MLSIPSLQLRIWHSDQLVRNGAVLLIHSSLLANRITFSLRDEVDPEVVVNATGSDAGKKSQRRSGGDDLAKHLHSETRQAVRGVEEANRSSIDTRFWWNPRHDKQKDLHQDEQADRNIPRFELRPPDADLSTLAADEVDANCHCEEK
jgi:hypothetical protein